MKRILYKIFKGFLIFLSLPPLWVGYLFSDLLFLFIYYIIGYRKKITIQNIKNSFPEKTDREIKIISKKFYRYLCDLVIEIMKMSTISRRQIIKRCTFSTDTTKLIQQLYDQKKNLLFAMGHFGNWEWASPITSLITNYQLFALYKPISSSFFNQFMYDIRTRFGSKLINMNHAWKEMLKNQASGSIHATAFITDQTPSATNAYWTTFLNQDTAVFTGIEKIAQKLNCPVVFVSVRKVKRGYYCIHTELIVEDSINTKAGEISELHTRKLEEEIRRQPEIWLWSHRRWKHKRPVTL